MTGGHAVEPAWLAVGFLRHPNRVRTRLGEPLHPASGSSRRSRRVSSPPRHRQDGPCRRVAPRHRRPLRNDNWTIRGASRATEHVTEHVTEQIARLLRVLGTDTGSSPELLTRLGLHHRPTFLYTYLQPALDQGLVERTLPDKPRSRLQRYRLTARGQVWLAAHASEP